MIDTNGRRVYMRKAASASEQRHGYLPAEIPHVPAEVMASVTIVVPVYNSAHTTRPCLRSVHKHTPTSVRVIVVDDCSDEHTARMIGDEVHAMSSGGRRASAVHNETNQRYTRTINKGFDLAVDAGAQWVVGLNSDTMVTPGWLQRMLTVPMNDDSVHVVCPYMMAGANLNLDVASGSSYLETAERLAARVKALNITPPAAVTPVGACMMVSAHAWKTHGPFDESVSPAGIGGYGEECDFWAKLPDACKVAPDAYVWHQGGSSYGSKAKHLAERAAVKKFLDRHGALYRVHIDRLRRRDPLPVLRHELPTVRVKSQRPRVGFFINGIQLCGGVLALVNICDRLIERGIDATIAFKHDRFNEWGLMPARFAPVHFHDPTNWIKAGGFDRGILVATAWHTGDMVHALAAKHRGIATAAFVQDAEWTFRRPGGELEYPRPENYAAYKRIVQRRAVVNSVWVKRKLVADQGVDEKVLTYIPIGVDTDLFYDRRLRDDDGPVRVLAFSRPSTPRRGYDLLAEVFKRVQDRYGKRVELVTYDQKPADVHTTHLNKLMQAQLAVEQSRAHILLEPSWSQGWGMPGQEMMASGGCLVSTDNGGIHNYGVHEENCLIAATNADALFEQMCRAIEDKALRERLGKAARERMLGLTWERVADAWATVITRWWKALG